MAKKAEQFQRQDNNNNPPTVRTTKHDAREFSYIRSGKKLHCNRLFSPRCHNRCSRWYAAVYGRVGQHSSIRFDKLFDTAQRCRVDRDRCRHPIMYMTPSTCGSTAWCDAKHCPATRNDDVIYEPRHKADIKCSVSTESISPQNRGYRKRSAVCQRSLEGGL